MYRHRVDIDERDLGREEVHIAARPRAVEGCPHQLGEIGWDFDRTHAIERCCHGDMLCRMWRWEVLQERKANAGNSFDEVITWSVRCPSTPAKAWECQG